MKKICLLVIGFALAACSTPASKQAIGTVADQHFSVMAFNVENLFDNKHDEGTEDFTYLPLAQKDTDAQRAACNKMNNGRYKDECLNMDWNEAVVKRKLERVADVILQTDEGRGPDLLLMEEVENKGILERLSKEYLRAAGYKHIVHIEGPDKRGIDGAMMSRLKLIGEPKLNKIPFKPKNAEDAEWMARSRGILQADFELPGGQKLRAFAVHFPSPSNPSYWREQAIEHLNFLKAQTPPEYLTLAGGDFNIAAEDERKNKFYQDLLGKNWKISHLIGCRGCRGTEYYHFKRQWSFLDALTFDPRLVDGSAAWKVDAASIRIPNDSRFQRNQYMSPARFDEKSPVGVSDHWPIYALIRKVNSTTTPTNMPPTASKGLMESVGTVDVGSTPASGKATAQKPAEKTEPAKR